MGSVSTQRWNMPETDCWAPRTEMRAKAGEAREEARDIQEWPAVRSMLMRVLEGFQEAKEAVLAGFRELQMTERTGVVQAEWEMNLQPTG